MYIIVPSYPSIYFAINQFNLGKAVVIITNNKSVNDFADHLGIKCVFFDFEINLRNTFFLRSKLNKILAILDLNEELYLLDNVHCVEGFYFSKKWTKGKVFHKNLSTEYAIYNDRINIKSTIFKFFLKYSLNLNLVFRNQNGKAVIGIDDFFLQSNSIRDLFIQDYLQIKLNVINELKFGYEKYNSLLILQGKLDGIVKPISLKNIFQEIIQLKSLVVKEHPKHKIKDFFLIESAPKIPDYFPVEMCYGSIDHNIISVFSLSLIIASKMNDKKAISLLELVDWTNESYKLKVKKMLIEKSSDKIYFPKTISELRNEISNERAF